VIYDEREFVTDRERRIARWLAIGMHAAFVVLVVFGVAWQKRYSEPAAIVDLWSTTAPPKAEPPRPVPRPEPKVERRPEPKIERKPEPKPAPKPEVKRELKPDIALREKLEKERKAKEELEKKKQAELRKKEDEAKRLKAEAKRLKAEARKKEETAEKERLLKEMELKRLAQEKADLAAKLAKEQAAARASLNDKYIALIQNHVKRQIVEPPNLQGNPQVEFDVVLIPGGEVLTVKLRRSSGVPAYDAAVERAILKASPLPLPPDPTLFQQFRDLHLKIRPKE
jgi:colicin import membrane protein